MILLVKGRPLESERVNEDKHLRCWQNVPIHPGVQVQCPSCASHTPPFWQWHSLLQFNPKNPKGQAVAKWKQENCDIKVNNADCGSLSKYLQNFFSSWKLWVQKVFQTQWWNLENLRTTQNWYWIGEGGSFSLIHHRVSYNFNLKQNKCWQINIQQNQSKHYTESLSTQFLIMNWTELHLILIWGGSVAEWLGRQT